MTELPCDDLGTESDDVFEYADNKLEIDDTRLSFLTSSMSFKSATGGGDATAFLGICGIFFCSSGSEAFGGSVGVDSFSGLGANRAPTLLFLAGKAVVVAVADGAGCPPGAI